MRHVKQCRIWAEKYMKGMYMGGYIIKQPTMVRMSLDNDHLHRAGMASTVPHLSF
jgi:hypothetical protein